MTAVPRATGLLVGYAADVLFGDPARWHPVAGFGRVAQRLESMTYADSRGGGVVFVLGCVAPVALLAAAVERSAGRWRAALIAAATWTVLGGAGLRREALAPGDLVTARRRLPSLCGRDPDGLDAAELARATVESLAENTADAVVAPLLWGAVAGIPGLLAYRTVNTLDAMVGHRSARYHRFGRAAAQPNRW